MLTPAIHAARKAAGTSGDAAAGDDAVGFNGGRRENALVGAAGINPPGGAGPCPHNADTGMRILATRLEMKGFWDLEDFPGLVDSSRILCKHFSAVMI